MSVNSDQWLMVMFTVVVPASQRVLWLKLQPDPTTHRHAGRSVLAMNAHR